VITDAYRQSHHRRRWRWANESWFISVPLDSQLAPKYRNRRGVDGHP
jgi:hypothetical protein